MITWSFSGATGAKCRWAKESERMEGRHHLRKWEGREKYKKGSKQRKGYEKLTARDSLYFCIRIRKYSRLSHQLKSPWLMLSIHACTTASLRAGNSFNPLASESTSRAFASHIYTELLFDLNDVLCRQTFVVCKRRPRFFTKIIISGKKKTTTIGFQNSCSWWAHNNS